MKLAFKKIYIKAYPQIFEKVFSRKEGTAFYEISQKQGGPVENPDGNQLTNHHLILKSGYISNSKSNRKYK